MASAELVARYYGYAARCWLFAKQQDDAGHKLALINLAQTWLALADYVEKNESPFALYETPPSKWRH
jgi:hypothetical protein